MSAAAGLAHKGESKSKKTYATLDINNIYKGKPLEGPKSSVGAGAKHGLQSLGKVQVGRRMPPPALLPSLKSENLGNNPNVTLVPTGGQGWGVSKSGGTSSPAASGTAGTTNSQGLPLDQATSHLDGRMGMPVGENGLSTREGGPLAGSKGGGNGSKTWSSVAVGVGPGGHHQHNGSHNQLPPFFPGEFPTLKTETAGGPPVGSDSVSPGGIGANRVVAGVAGSGAGLHSGSNVADREGLGGMSVGLGGGTGVAPGGQYGPGPALRPQESNWSRGSAGAGSAVSGPMGNAGSGVNGAGLPGLKPRPPSPLGSSPGDPLGMGYPPALSKGLSGHHREHHHRDHHHHHHHGGGRQGHSQQSGDHRVSMMANGAAPLFGRERDEREGGSGSMGTRSGRSERGSRGERGGAFRGERGGIESRHHGGDASDAHSKSVLKHSTIISDQQLEGFDRILSTGDSDWSAAKGDIDYNAKLCFSDDEDADTGDDGDFSAGHHSQQPLSSGSAVTFDVGRGGGRRDHMRESASPLSGAGGSSYHHNQGGHGGGYGGLNREQPSQKRLWTSSGHHQSDARGDLPRDMDSLGWRGESRHSRLKDGREAGGSTGRRGAALAQQQCVFDDDHDGSWRHKSATGNAKSAKNEMNECVERARMMRRDSERQLSERVEPHDALLMAPLSDGAFGDGMTTGSSRAAGLLSSGGSIRKDQPGGGRRGGSVANEMKQQLPPRFAKLHHSQQQQQQQLQQQGNNESNRLTWSNSATQSSSQHGGMNLSNNRSRSDSSSSNNNLSASSAMDSQQHDSVWQMNKENRARSMRNDDNKSPSPGVQHSDGMWPPTSQDNLAGKGGSAGWSDQSGLFDSQQQQQQRPQREHGGKQASAHASQPQGFDSGELNNKQHRSGFGSLKKEGSGKKDCETDSISLEKSESGSLKTRGGPAKKSVHHGGGHDSDGVMSSNDEETPRGFSPRGEPSRRGRGGGRSGAAPARAQGGVTSARQLQQPFANEARGGSGGATSQTASSHRDQQPTKDRGPGSSTASGGYSSGKESGGRSNRGQGGRAAGGNATSGRMERNNAATGVNQTLSSKEDTASSRFRRHEEYDDHLTEEDEQRGSASFGGGKFGQGGRSQRDSGKQQQQQQQQVAGGGSREGSRQQQSQAGRNMSNDGGRKEGARERGREERGSKAAQDNNKKSQDNLREGMRAETKSAVLKDKKLQDGGQHQQKKESALKSSSNVDQQCMSGAPVATKKDSVSGGGSCGSQSSASQKISGSAVSSGTLISSGASGSQKKDISGASATSLKKDSSGSNSACWGDPEVAPSSGPAGIEFGTLGESEDLNLKIQSVKKVWDSTAVGVTASGDTSSVAAQQNSNNQVHSGHAVVSGVGAGQSAGSVGPSVVPQAPPQQQTSATHGSQNGGPQTAAAAAAVAQQMSFFQMTAGQQPQQQQDPSAAGGHKGDPSGGSPLQVGVSQADMASTAQHVVSSLQQAYVGSTGQQQTAAAAQVQQQGAQTSSKQQQQQAALGHPQQQQQQQYYQHLMQHQKYHQAATGAASVAQQQQRSVHHQMAPSGYGHATAGQLHASGHAAHAGQTPLDAATSQHAMMRAAFAAHSAQHQQQQPPQHSAAAAVVAQMYSSQFQSPPPPPAAAAHHGHLAAAAGQAGPASSGPPPPTSDHSQYTTPPHSYFSQQQPPQHQPPQHAAAAAAHDIYRYQQHSAAAAAAQQQQQQQQQHGQYRKFFPAPSAAAPGAAAAGSPFGSAAQQGGHYHQLGGHHYASAAPMQTPPPQPPSAAAFSAAAAAAANMYAAAGHAHSGHNSAAVAQQAAVARYGQAKAAEVASQQHAPYDHTTPPPHSGHGQQQQTTTRQKHIFN